MIVRKVNESGDFSPNAPIVVKYSQGALLKVLFRICWGRNDRDCKSIGGESNRVTDLVVAKLLDGSVVTEVFP